MKAKRYLPLWIALLLASLMLFGCGTSEPTDTPTPEIVTESESPTKEPTVKPTETQAPPTETAAPPTATATPLPPTTTPEPTAMPEPPTPTPEPTPVWATDLVGVWFKPEDEDIVNSQDFYVQFYEDGTYRLSETPGGFITSHLTEGRYWFEGDTFLMAGIGGQEACPADEVGSYQISVIAGESIRLVQIDEPCYWRSMYSEGTWTWVSL